MDALIRILHRAPFVHARPRLAAALFVFVIVVLLLPTAFAEWLAFWTDTPPKDWLADQMPELPWGEIVRWGAVVVALVVLIAIFLGQRSRAATKHDGDGEHRWREEAKAKMELAGLLMTAETARDEVSRSLDKQRPLVEWAEALIQRERENPMRYLSVTTSITNALHLLDNNPYIDVIIRIDYRGVLQLTIGESISGRMAYGEPFADRPEVSGGTLPLMITGPGGATIRLRQFLREGTRDNLVGWLDRGPSEIEISIHDLDISLKMELFDRERIYGGLLPLGLFIEQAVEQPWRDGIARVSEG